MKHSKCVLFTTASILFFFAATACTVEPPADETTSPETTAAETDSAPPPAESGAGPAPGTTRAVTSPGAQAPQPAAAPKPQPKPAPEPQPVIVTLPAGTALTASFLNDVSSNGSQVGDDVRASVVQDVVHNGVSIIPAGSEVVGSVTEAVPLTKKIGGRAKLTVAFHTIELTSGGMARITAALVEKGKSETKKDAATIGGAAAGGAILGTVIKGDDKEKGALIGAVVGAAAGTAVAMKTEGKEVTMPAGTVITVVLDQPTEITVQP